MSIWTLMFHAYKCKQHACYSKGYVHVPHHAYMLRSHENCVKHAHIYFDLWCTFRLCLESCCKMCNRICWGLILVTFPLSFELLLIPFHNSKSTEMAYSVILWIYTAHHSSCFRGCPVALSQGHFKVTDDFSQTKLNNAKVYGLDFFTACPEML